MYIPEFWCGVIATVAAELVAFVVYCISLSLKKKK